MNSLNNIYNRHLKNKPGFIGGNVTLKLTVPYSGGNAHTINIASSTTSYPEFDSAVKNAVATWKWNFQAYKLTPTITPTSTISFNFLDNWLRIDPTGRTAGRR